MLSIPFNLNDAPPAVRRPVVELQFGSGRADDWRRAFVQARVDIGLAPVADVLHLILSSDEQAPAVNVGDEGSISLGYEDSSAELVFTGQIESVQSQIRGIYHISVTNGGARLARQRANQTFEQQKAGAITKELSASANVTVGNIEDGPEFPFYVVDDRRSLYDCVGELARKCGCLAYCAPDDKLNVTPATAGEAVRSFTHGVDILSLEVRAAAPVVATITSVGEGAAGSQGQEAWSWLVKDPASVSGSTGSDPPQRLISDASLRSADAAQSAADGILAKAALGNSVGALWAPGAPAVTVASTITIDGAPQQQLNGPAIVRRLRHCFSKRDGYTTWIEFYKLADDASGLASLGGLS